MVCKCYSIVSFHNFATTFFVFLSPRHTFVPNGYFSPSSPRPSVRPSFSFLVTFASHFPQTPFSPPRSPRLFLSLFPSPSLFSPLSTTSPAFSTCPPLSNSPSIPLAHLCQLVSTCVGLSFCVALVSTCPLPLNQSPLVTSCLGSLPARSHTLTVPTFIPYFLISLRPRLSFFSQLFAANCVRFRVRGFFLPIYIDGNCGEICAGTKKERGGALFDVVFAAYSCGSS